jgi:Reverse transcriptase (RNA-dependent DNA polymerase)
MGWPLKKIKRYPHFDAMASLDELTALATNPQAVDSNAFLPFLLYFKRWNSFQSLTKESKSKERPIRYASRRDGAIFSYYRHLLSERYEAALIGLEIQDCPIAYRKMPAASGTGGKCNIDFAAEAFSCIRTLKSCCAVTLDISGFFENIDHASLKRSWNRLLGTHRLPRDHAAVFKAITQYVVVEREAAYERLGFIGEKLGPKGQPVKGYLIPRHKIPVQLCCPTEFRRKICGQGDAYKKLIVRNKLPHGIPQGAPISDLLANIYLIDFDIAMNAYAKQRGGTYRRYSDDILIVLPGGEAEAHAAEAFASLEIKKIGKTLEIKSTKTAIVTFVPGPAGSLFATRIDKPANRDGVEYLGFRFDGRQVYIRNSTMAKYYRGITFAARRRANMIVRRYYGKDMAFLLQKFNMVEFEARFGKVMDFESTPSRLNWTFRTYVKRCARVFGEQGRYFFRQTRHYQGIMKRLAVEEIDRALRKHRNTPSQTVELV